MYQFLRSYLPEPFAKALTTLWYVVLVAIVLYFSFEPKAEFNYLNV